MLALLSARTIDAHTPDLYQFGRIDTGNIVINKIINIPVTLIKFALLEVVVVAMLVETLVEAALVLVAASLLIGLAPILLTMSLIVSICQCQGPGPGDLKRIGFLGPLAGLAACVVIPVIIIPSLLLFYGVSCGIVLPVCLLGITSEKSGDSSLFSLFKLNRLFCKIFEIDFVYWNGDPREILRVRRLDAETIAKRVRTQETLRIARDRQRLTRENMQIMQIQEELAEEKARSDLEATLRQGNIFYYNRVCERIRAGLENPAEHTALPFYDRGLLDPPNTVPSSS